MDGWQLQRSLHYAERAAERQGSPASRRAAASWAEPWNGAGLGDGGCGRGGITGGAWETIDDSFGVSTPIPESTPTPKLSAKASSARVGTHGLPQPRRPDFGSQASQGREDMTVSSLLQTVQAHAVAARVPLSGQTVPALAPPHSAAAASGDQLAWARTRNAARPWAPLDASSSAQ